MSLKLSGTQLGNITGGPSSLNLYELADVSIVAPVTGQYLRYNTTISEWQNRTINLEVYNFLNTNLTGSNGVVLTKVSGPQTVDIGLNITVSGDATGDLTSGDIGLTLATVNANVGTFGSASTIPIVTVNAKGLITAISQTAFTGTAPLATSLAGGSTGSLPYQSATGVTSFLSSGTTSQVLIGSPTAPSWSNTPTLTGTNFTGIPNGALTNNSLTIGSTNIALGATSTTLAGLTSVTSTAFTGALTGAASLNVLKAGDTITGTLNISAGGMTIGTSGGQVLSSDDNNANSSNFRVNTVTKNTALYAFDVARSGTTVGGIKIDGSALFTTVNATTFTGSGSGLTNIPSGALSNIPNSALTNSSVTIGSTNIALGATSTTLVGLTSVTSSSFVGALTGNASTATVLAIGRTFSLSTDATGTSASFDGSGNATIPMTLATVNASPQTDTFRKITVNGKGLTTATSAVSAGDITTALGYTPVNKAGDTMTGFLILNANPTAALGAVTKQYVDAVSAGLNVHASCVTATTATLASSSSGTVTYYNGVGNDGVGATLTTTGSFATIGGFAVPDTSRVLVKSEATQANNGIYVKDSNTQLTRATDFDNSPPGEIASGDFTFIVSGTVAGTNWAMTTPGTITVGTTAIVFSQLSGPGVYTAGTGIDITTNVISNTGVLSNVAGTGISVSSSTGNVTVTNTGVTSLTGTTNQVTVSSATGAVTVSLPSSVTIGGTMTAGTFSGAGTNLTGTASGLSIGGNAATATSATSATSATNSAQLGGIVAANYLYGANGSGSNTLNVTENVYELGQYKSGFWDVSGAAWMPTNDYYWGATFAHASNTNSYNYSGQLAFRIGTGGDAIFGRTISNGTPTAWSRLLSSANYVSYAPTLTGSGASGTWGINISGTSTSSAYLVPYVVSSASGAKTGRNVWANGAYTYSTVSDPNTPTTYMAMLGAGSGTSGSFEIGANWISGGTGIWYRTLRDTIDPWTGWYRILDSASYNSYSPTLTGGGASGTWGINITGNAVTLGGLALSAGTNNQVNQVVRTNGSGYCDFGWINTVSGDNGVTAPDRIYASSDAYLRYYTPTNFRTVMGLGALTTANSWSGANQFVSTSSTAAGSNPGLQAFSSSGNGAYMAFHRGGIYAVNMGLDTDNVFRIGGWSAPANVLQLDMSGNLTVNGNYNVVNYGLGMTGVYDSTKYQSIFSMGSAYRPAADGTSLSNMYGVAYTHTNVGGESKAGLSHQALFVTAGVTQTAIGTGIWTNGNITLGTTNALIYLPNGNYIRQNTGTYGTLEVGGTQNGYGGIYLPSCSGTTVGMYDASGNGGDYDSTTSWHTYWNRSQSCLAVGGSTTAAGYKLYVHGSQYVAGSLAVNGSSSATAGDITTNRAGGTTGVVYFGTSGGKYLYYDATNFQIQGGGLVVSGDVTAFSDIRVKKNIEIISDALNKVSAIRGVTFQRTDVADTERRHSGVIAQEVEEVLPEVVMMSDGDANGNPGMKTVAYGNMVGLLIEAIKELNAKVETLKAEIATLKA